MAHYINSERDEQRLEKIIDLTTGSILLGTATLILLQPNITQPLKNITYTLYHYLLP